MLWIRFVLFLFLSTAAFSQELPAGTVVPVMVNTDLNAQKDKAGKKIEGKVMQDVPLLAGQISKGARVTGHVVSVKKPESGSDIVIQFDDIEDGNRSIAWTAAVLAVASMSSVSEAQLPINNTGTAQDSSEFWITRQVGGDLVNREQRRAGSSGGQIGTWLGGSSVLIKLTPNPDAGCPDGPAYKGAQAVWIFSSAACGTYGFDDVVIASSGAEAPVGEIMLGSSQNVNVRGGSGWLLMTVSAH